MSARLDAAREALTATARLYALAVEDAAITYGKLHEIGKLHDSGRLHQRGIVARLTLAVTDLERAAIAYVAELTLAAAPGATTHDPYGVRAESPALARTMTVHAFIAGLRVADVGEGGGS